jgi:hypothetical protein
MAINLNPKVILTWLIKSNRWFWPGLAVALVLAGLQSWSGQFSLGFVLAVFMFISGFLLAHMIFESEPWLRHWSDLIFSAVESAQNSHLTNDFVTPLASSDDNSTSPSMLRHSLMLVVIPIVGITLLLVSRNLLGRGLLWGLTILYAIDIFPILNNQSHPQRQRYFGGWPLASEAPLLIVSAYCLYTVIFTIALLIL